MINKVILLGNVGKDPDVRHLDNNATVARFSLATSESYKNKNGEKVTNTEWHNIVAWRNHAEFAGKYIKKGTLLYVEGKIRTRSWDDKDGNKRYTTEIEVENFQLLSRRSDDQGQATPAVTAASSNNAMESELNNGFDYSATPQATDDLPF
jgi:single-strand DNA-binding protein